jgi:ParB family chromosome partitioning protein
MSKAQDMAQRYGATIAGVVGRRPGPESLPAAPPPPDPYAGAVKIPKFAELPIEAIERDPSQPRQAFDEAELRRLAASIERFGQLAPIRVRRDEARGVWVVLVGERRLRACALAGQTKVRVEFVERAFTEADVLAEQTIENVVRADLRPLEEGRAFRRLQELNGWNVEELASAVGIEATTAHRRLGLLRLAEDVAALVDAGKIDATAAYEISKLQIADDQRAVAALVVGKDLNHTETVAEVRRRQAVADAQVGKGKAKGRGAKGKPPKVTRRPLRTAAGYRISVEHRRGVDDEGLRAALAEALGQLDAPAEGRAEAAA